MMTIFAAHRLLGVGLGAVLAATAPVITMALSPPSCSRSACGFP